MRRITLQLMLVFLFSILIYPQSFAASQISFWTTETEKDRVDVQKAIALEFTQKTGIGVKVIPVQENLLSQKVTAAYAARSLPDVIFHPMEFTIGWVEAGVLDAAAATEAVESLGVSTFGQGALNLVKVSGGYGAIPMDGWGQILLYRKDLFAEKNLAVPNTWDNILAAAKALNNPPLIWGFEAATDPGQTYTQQVFEHIALSNGVRLVDKNGQVNLNTPAMVQTLKFYKSLVKLGPPGNLYWLHTRLDYLSGRSAMTVWSPYILDELSGLRRDQPVLPDIAKGKPGFLANNTGFVSIIKGPNGSGQYGQLSYLGITVDADKKAAKKWAMFLLSEGYLRWLSMAPEGKLPVRKGDQASPAKYINGWLELEFGVTTRAKISEFYGIETIKTIVSGVDGFDRWGFAQGKGTLVAKIYGTKVIPEVLKKYLDGELTAEQAAAQMDKKVKALE